MWRFHRVLLPSFSPVLHCDPSIDVKGVRDVEWSWRPAFLRHPTPRLAPQLDKTLDLGHGASLHHDSDSAEGFMTRPFGAQPVPLRLDLFFFEGSDIELRFSLPQEVAQCLSPHHILTMNLEYWAEREVSLQCEFAFQGPQFTRRTALNCTSGTTFSLDLKEFLGRKIQLSTVAFSLRLVRPQLTAFLLKDLSFVLYSRADL